MKIYNSLTRKKEEFMPIKKGKIGMYVCGPTVYDEPHIGHARSAYIFDVIRRYLLYKGFSVEFVRNITDVDDKIINKAREDLAVTQSSIQKVVDAPTIKKKATDIAEKYLTAYHEDMALLGIEKPDKEPRATEYIEKMTGFIRVLIEKGCAYEADGDVYFDIKKAKDYGKLSNQNVEKMEAGARITPGENKKDPLDFALWKKAKDGEPFWSSPWSNGRPGWHIECSAMSSNILGDEFDIHGGGIDLIFPHHENEIAQSEGAGKKFARYWLHNGLLTINGEKMAKSLGNFITIKDFLAKYKDADYLKLLFLNTHYRHPVDYADEKIEEMRKEKERFKILFDKLRNILLADASDKVSKKEKGTSLDQLEIEIERFKQKFEQAMDDDFNTPLALAALFDIVSYANKIIHEKEKFNQAEIKLLSKINKLLGDLLAIFGLSLWKSSVPFDADFLNWILDLRDKREQARKNKDFKKADEIRKTLLEKGIILEDTKEGPVWRLKV